MQPLKIQVERLKLHASVGIYANEKKKKQVIYVSATLSFRHANYHIDKMESSVDYDLLCAEIRRVAALRHYELIENLALHIARALKTLSRCHRVAIHIDKPLAARKNRAQNISTIVEL